MVTSGSAAVEARVLGGVTDTVVASSWKLLVCPKLYQQVPKCTNFTPVARAKKLFLRSPVSSVNANLPPRSSVDLILSELPPSLPPSSTPTVDTHQTLEYGVTNSTLDVHPIRSAHYQAKTDSAKCVGVLVAPSLLLKSPWAEFPRLSSQLRQMTPSARPS